MPHVNVNGIRLAYEEAGAGHPILLVHGFPLSRQMWTGQLAGLADEFRLIAVDLRGFGESSVTPGTATMEHMADDLAALLPAIGLRQPVTFCGLSMGGYVAWQFVRKHRPLLHSLILCDTRAVADTAEAAAGRRKTAEKVLEQGAEIVWQAMRTKLFAERTLAEQPATVEAVRKMMLGTQPAGIAAAALGMAERPDSTKLLASIDVPSLVIVGYEDAISPPAEMRTIADAIPDCGYAEIAGAGHMAPLESATAVNRVIREFLARV